MAGTVYFDTSIFIEIGSRQSKYTKQLKMLLKDLQENNIRIYTSILTVQELSVAAHRKGAVVRDSVSHIQRIARIYTLTKEIALTAAKREAELKEFAQIEETRRDPKNALAREQKIDRICENRRRKWDCFHIATAQVLECQKLYTTDIKLQKRKHQLDLRGLEIVPPPEALRTVEGPLFEKGEK